MSESMFLTLEDICKFLATDITSQNISFAELAFQLLKLFTVMAGSFAGKGRCVINIHEMVLTPGAFEIIFNFHEDDTSVCSTLTSNDVQTLEDQLSPHNYQPQKKGRRLSINEKFPSIVNCITEFI